MCYFDRTKKWIARTSKEISATYKHLFGKENLKSAITANCLWGCLSSQRLFFEAHKIHIPLRDSNFIGTQSYGIYCIVVISLTNQIDIISFALLVLYEWTFCFMHPTAISFVTLDVGSRTLFILWFRKISGQDRLLKWDRLHPYRAVKWQIYRF